MARYPLNKQIDMRLNSLIDFSGNDSGISAKKADSTKIYAQNTLDTYKRECCAFARWAKATAAENGEKTPHTIADIRKYAEDYLRRTKADGSNYSAFTLKTERAAIAKLYGVRCRDIAANLPIRHRADITRSRGVSTADKHYNPKNYPDVEALGRGAGLRRGDISRLHGRDVIERPDGLHLRIDIGKGGKSRDILVLPQYADAIRELAARTAPDERLIPRGKVPKALDEHAYRREYVREMYALVARDPATLTKSERIHTRGDAKGLVFDRAAVAFVSRQLGHGSQKNGVWRDRTNVVVEHYLV